MNKEAIEQHGFLLIERVDETSKAVVWRAMQKTLERIVILHILKEEFAQDPQEINQFLTVARHIARIKSDALAAVYDVVSAPPVHYVVMEHVEGDTLDEELARKGPLPQEQALRIGATLSTGIEQMWRTAHLVHRNLKSASVRLDSRGLAKITDFSLTIAANQTSDRPQHEQDVIVGTPCFLSPEQAQASPSLTTQSDMYAFGMLLYHLVTGHLPFEELDVISILEAQIKQQTQPPHVLQKTVSDSFSWFLHKLLMKQPKDRYANWHEVQQEIQNLLENRPLLCLQHKAQGLSTIDMAGIDQKIEEPGENKQPPNAPRIRVNRIKKNVAISDYQSKNIIDEHVNEILREKRLKEMIWWVALCGWLTLVFWFRAIYQNELPQKLVIPHETQDASVITALDENTIDQELTEFEVPSTTPDAGNAPPDVIEVQAKKPEPTETNEEQNERIARDQSAQRISALARAFMNNDLPTARKLVHDAPTNFTDKNDLIALLDQMPEPDALFKQILKTQIGKYLTFAHQGKSRTIIIRTVDEKSLQIEANGKTASIPIDSLSTEDKLQWMYPPDNTAGLATYCLMLMQAGRQHELQDYAMKCPLLAPIFLQLDTLQATSITPDAQ